MKIVHTADWHLGHIFYGHDRREEHAAFLSWLLDVLQREMPDALVIAGDVFDASNPPASAEAMLFDFLVEAGRRVSGLQVVMTAGNHDSAGRLEAPAALLKLHNVYVRGLVGMTEKGEPDFNNYVLPLSSRTGSEAECVCLAVPFLRSSDYPSGLSQEEGLAYFFSGLRKALKKSEFKNLPTFAAAHFYAAGAEVADHDRSERLVAGGQDRVDVAACEKALCYLALGHIHKAQRVGRSMAYYAGSALPMSFSERGYRHGVQIVELTEEGEATVRREEFSPLRGLIRVPQSGAATVAQALNELAELPKRKASDENEWPYLEICIAEEQPEPTLLNDINEILKEKGVRFCRIVRHTHAAEALADAAPAPPDLLNELQPEDLALRVFRERYGADMPDEMKKRFRLAAAAERDE